MRLFRFLADFRYFQGKFHHFCKSSKSGLNFFGGGGGGPETVFRCHLDNSGGVYNWHIRLRTFVLNRNSVEYFSYSVGSR